MSFSSKIDKPLPTSSVVPPSLTIQRKSFHIPHHQEIGRGQVSLQARMERAAVSGHNLSQISLSHTPTPIQTKLTIGTPGDRYEQEADRVAQQVMTMKQPIQRQEAEQEEQIQGKIAIQRQEKPEEEELAQTKPLSATITPLIQRQATPEEEEVQSKPLYETISPLIQREEMPKEEEEKTAQMKTIQREEKEEEVQPKSVIQARANTDGLEQQLSSTKGGGSPLSEDVRNFMEPRFGADFSQVRVHTDSSAVQMNQDVQAQAFTHGKDIYFNSGKYSPDTSEGKSLLAHELTHVIQQTGSS